MDKVQKYNSFNPPFYSLNDLQWPTFSCRSELLALDVENRPIRIKARGQVNLHELMLYAPSEGTSQNVNNPPF
jgi:uncharacterized membrane protein